MKFNNIFSIPESYKTNLESYSTKDAILAFTSLLLYISVMLLCGLISGHVSDNIYILIASGINILFVILVFLFLKIQNNNILTLGLIGGNLKLSLILGISLSFILFFCNCISNVLFSGQHFISIQRIILNFFYYSSVALCEEVLFRGYILTRIHVITKNIIIDLIITGVLFVLFHFPFRFVFYNLSFIKFITNYSYILNLFFTHIILSLIRIKSDNIWGSIIPHWISNLSYSIVSHI